MEAVQNDKRTRGLRGVFGGRAKSSGHLWISSQDRPQRLRLGGIDRHAQDRLGRQLQRGLVIRGEGVARRKLRLQKARRAGAKLEAGFAVRPRREREALRSGRQISRTVGGWSESER